MDSMKDNYSEFCIIVPARIGSTRLPKKLLKKIDDKFIINHVVERLLKLNIDIYIATDSDEIKQALHSMNAEVIMTESNINSGSDRVFEAYKQIKKSKKYNYIINVQGDMPFLDPMILEDIVLKFKNESSDTKFQSDIITPYVKIDYEKAHKPENVKIVASASGRAMYFSRSLIPYSQKPENLEYLYHVGIYGFREYALEKFCNLDQGIYEKNESLEQLRALENNMIINLIESKQIPISIDTEHDYLEAIKYYNAKLKPLDS